MKTLLPLPHPHETRTRAATIDARDHQVQWPRHRGKRREDHSRARSTQPLPGPLGSTLQVGNTPTLEGKPFPESLLQPVHRVPRDGGQLSTQPVPGADWTWPESPTGLVQGLHSRRPQNPGPLSRGCPCSRRTSGERCKLQLDICLPAFV